jgi:hypothetical protein
MRRARCRETRSRSREACAPYPAGQGGGSCEPLLEEIECAELRLDRGEVAEDEVRAVLGAAPEYSREDDMPVLKQLEHRGAAVTGS